MDKESKIAKIRFDAEHILNFPLAKSAFWVNWKKANLEMLSDEDFKNLDVRKAAELLASQYRRANPEKRKPELSITKSPEEIEADKAKAERYAKFLAQKSRR
jgi:topoisomerase IA-like protein